MKITPLPHILNDIDAPIRIGFWDIVRNGVAYRVEDLLEFLVAEQLEQVQHLIEQMVDENSPRN